MSETNYEISPKEISQSLEKAKVFVNSQIGKYLSGTCPNTQYIITNYLAMALYDLSNKPSKNIEEDILEMLHEGLKSYGDPIVENWMNRTLKIIL